ncbi:hypothetical protein ILYODFUR_017075 [Ilyodon furcidens]|uniref:Uncharacterized protein n=1 Tax=Ilyodon furcidens TaxID=33524 RepID=A0ABV0UUJ3_9TELE
MGRGSEEKYGGTRVLRVCDQHKNGKLLHPKRRKYEEPLQSTEKQGGASSPWKQNLCGFYLYLGCISTVFDQDMDLLIFLYQTDFQLSRSSGNGQCGGKVNPSASFYFSRDAPLRRDLRLEMAVKSLFPLFFISSDDVRALSQLPAEL